MSCVSYFAATGILWEIRGWIVFNLGGIFSSDDDFISGDEGILRWRVIWEIIRGCSRFEKKAGK